MHRSRLVLLTGLLALTAACGQPQAAPEPGIASGVAKDAELAKLVPQRLNGKLRIASSIGGTPPSAFYADDGKTAQGVDIDVADAAAKLLGLEVERQAASFEAILPALTSGKYDAGTGNFGVTEERKKTIDFVTYINDGQGFAARKDSALQDVKKLDQLCGLKIGTGTGTTFQTTLERNKEVCADAGKPAYEVQVFSDTGATQLALKQGHVDVIMSTINGLRHLTANQPDFRFLGEFRRLDVGFALPKGSDLAPALRQAVDRLISDGTYQRILRRWGVEPSAIPRSELNPAEHT
ncbi:ABC transporter substrate-binding protein [Lentzea sp. NPDC042327]|uniref:ABC transporter substrate-binding protein n=1 Tax=Lentzea sp. NPDC042327 TaxID=3154801 RepID=UPI0033DC34A8